MNSPVGRMLRFELTFRLTISLCTMESIRNWFSSNLGSNFMAHQESLLKWEATSMDELIHESDEVYEPFFPFSLA